MLNSQIALVTRSLLVKKTRGQKSLLSRTFIIRFQDGTEVLKNSQSWVMTDVIKQHEVGAENNRIMTKQECPLYYQ